MSMLIMATAFASGNSGWATRRPIPESQFLAREVQKQNAALLLRLRREPSRQFDHPGGAGSVVVGARMNRRHRRRQRKLPAHPQMVVMRAQNHVLIGSSPVRYATTLCTVFFTTCWIVDTRRSRE